MGWSVLTIVIAILVILLLVAAIIMRHRYNRKPNYKAFFIIGLTWIPLGIATGNNVFPIAGLVMMIVGISKRKEWRDESNWKDLPPAVKRFKIIIIGVITLVLLALIAMMLLRK